MSPGMEHILPRSFLLPLFSFLPLRFLSLLLFRLLTFPLQRPPSGRGLACLHARARTRFVANTSRFLLTAAVCQQAQNGDTGKEEDFFFLPTTHTFCEPIRTAFHYFLTPLLAHITLLAIKSSPSSLPTLCPGRWAI